MHLNVAGTRLCFLAAGLAVLGCRPSAQIQRASKIANLQVFEHALVRVRSPNVSTATIGSLGNQIADKIYGRCAFRSVSYPARGALGTDLIVDVNILESGKKNQLNISLVLSDGVSDELLGSANIQGVSGVFRSKASQASAAVASEVASLLRYSGCNDPRIARRTQPAAQSSELSRISPAQKKDAEEKNGEGKQLFRAGNVEAAKALFIDAVSLSPDPKYQFNLCLAHEGLGEIARAKAACRKTLDMGPPDYLRRKVQLRLEILSENGPR